ncbi:MAG: zeta toxin family protein [Proteobacteria bacterium]|nr:zeta toxin family protein [Pseudomonadota bacterium]
MKESKQLWLLAGGNGAGKSTFYREFLEKRGMKFINADIIAKAINPEYPESVSYDAANLAEKLREQLIQQGTSFCFETVFSHISKIDFIAKAKALGYEVILVYIHLESTDLNEARVLQRVSEGGHNVPAVKIRTRIPRTMKHIAKVLPLVDEARLLDNSSRTDPFKQVVRVKKGRYVKMQKRLPLWAKELLNSLTEISN